MRTSWKEFNLKDVDNNYIHLTNDAIQHKSSDYGKHESWNKLSFNDFEKYLDSIGSSKQFYKHVYPKIKKLVRDTFLWSFDKIDPHRRINGFELYGFDIMLDEDFNVYLIEVNTNPCLETPSSLLSSIISSVLDHTFKITLDILYPNPSTQQSKYLLIIL